MKHTPASYEGEHVVLTGPITGTVTLEDGTVVDVTREAVAANSPEQAAEIAHAIGLHWSQAENIHPQQIDRDENGREVGRNDFVYDDSGYKAAKKALKKDGN